MRIGLDFDNTVVGYDALFHQLALARGLIPAGLPVHKQAVRDHLRACGREADWTRLQGVAYGPAMPAAVAFAGVQEVVRAAQRAGHEVQIVSHKTRHPMAADAAARTPPPDLHAAARAWVQQHLRDASGPLLRDDQVSFEPTKAAKVERIGRIGCEVFVDDLPEIFAEPGFPAHTRRVLFDPQGQYASSAEASRACGARIDALVRSWADIARWLGLPAISRAD